MNRTALTLVVILTAGLLGFFIYTVVNYEVPSASSEISENDNHVLRVIDGDTIELSNGEIVRLICVDAPEVDEAGYEEAKDFLNDLVYNKEVRLEKDVSETDAYGRLLRYVYVNVSEGSSGAEVSSDGFTGVSGSGEEREVFVNREMVARGYAAVFRYGDDTARCNEIASSG